MGNRILCDGIDIVFPFVNMHIINRNFAQKHFCIFASKSAVVASLLEGKYWQPQEVKDPFWGTDSGLVLGIFLDKKCDMMTISISKTNNYLFVIGIIN